LWAERKPESKGKRKPGSQRKRKPGSQSKKKPETRRSLGVTSHTPRSVRKCEGV